MSHDVFISHSSQDSQVSLSVCNVLENRQIRCWIAPRDILPGDRWSESVMDAIEQTQVMVVIVSDNSCDSQHVQAEVERAVERRIKLLPMRISGQHLAGSLEFLLKPHQFLEAVSGSMDAHFETLAGSVATQLEKGHGAAPDTGALRQVSAQVQTQPKATAENEAPAFDRSARELLFGVLAVQLDLITSDQFTDACAGWLTQKKARLADLMVDRGWIDHEDRDDVERFLKRRLKQFQNDIAASLQASLKGELRSQLRSIGSAEITSTIDAAHQMSTETGLDTVEHGDAVVPELDHFELTRLWEEGGLGQIWLAQDWAADRQVAIKMLPEHRRSSTSARNRLLQEARITGRLEHPGVVPVYAVGDSANGDFFYAMRLVRGKTLKELISEFHNAAENGGIDREQRRSLLRSLVSVTGTVAYAHSQGVVHLDLKPANIVVGMFHEVSLLDWGLAAQLPESAMSSGKGSLADLNLEIAQQPLGTPAYMAPEQARADYKLIGPRTDVYGLGSILFEILNGQPPHRGENRDKLIDAVGAGLSPTIDGMAEVPDMLAQLCSRAMSFDPADRFSSALDFGEALESWLADEPLLIYQHAVGLFLNRVRANPDSLPAHEGLARYRVYLALVLSGMDRNSEADQVLAEAIGTYQMLKANRPRNARYRADLAATLLHRRSVLRRMGHGEQAEVVSREAVREYELLVENGEESAQQQSLIAMSLLSLDDEGRSSETVPVSALIAELAASRAAVDKADSPGPEDTVMELQDEEEAIEGPISPEAHSGGSESASRFEIRESFATGGLSELFIAKDHQLHREVILKTIRQEYRSKPAARAQLRLEAEIAGRLQCPGVLPVYAAGDFQDGQPFYVMPQVDGSSLRDEVASFFSSMAGPVKRFDDWAQYLQLNLHHLELVCQTVAFAHDRGIMHGDIKPSNVLLANTGETFLLDWGLARVVERTDTEISPLIPVSNSVSLGQAGVTGTPAFMSPEQTENRNVDHRSDIFGLGGTLYFILTARAPYKGKIAKALEAAFTVNVKPPRKLNRFVPEELDRICMKAMTRNKADRYQTACELASEIRTWLNTPEAATE